MAITILAPPASRAPFDVVADSYDDIFSNSLIGRAQRRAVWRELDRTFHPGQRILELNCGTGVDALHLARCGVSVVACDASPRMIAIARARLAGCNPAAPVRFRELATEDISRIEYDGQFDGAYSNFAGLNCVRHMQRIGTDLERLMRPRAALLICVFGRTVPWEIVWYLAKGNPRKAIRRLRKSVAVGELAEGVKFPVYYHSLRELAKAFEPAFQLKAWSGIGITVPPSYLEPLARRFPSALRVLAKTDQHLSRWPIFRSLGDHILLWFERRET